MRKISDEYCLNLFRLIVGARAGWKCEICGHVGADCNPHHIYSRDNKSVRYDPENGLWVCEKDHRWAELVGTKKIIEYLDCTRLRPEGWRDDLTNRKNQIVKFNDSFRTMWKEKLLNELGEAA